jgi:deoxyribodipyrimidine photolyase-like uncharacterized protein
MSLKKTNLSIAELCKLNSELNSEKGLLSERLPMVFKYHLSKLAAIAASEQAAVDKLKDETIRTLGEATDDGNITIAQFISAPSKKRGGSNNVTNPSYTKFIEEMQALFDTIREIEYEEFFISDLKNVESGENYPVFFKLFD